jgi:hypothetical protein
MNARVKPALDSMDRRPAQKRGSTGRKILHVGVAIPE